MNKLLRRLFDNARIATIPLDVEDYYAAMDAMYTKF